VRIPDHNKELNKLLRNFRPAPEAVASNGHAPSPACTDEEILEKLRREEGGKFERLWRGDASEYNGDHSAADHAFVFKVFPYTQDEEQIRRLHAASGLSRDKSLDRDDYLQRSIDDAREKIDFRYPWGRQSRSRSLSREGSGDPPETDTDLVQSIKATTLCGRGKPAPRGWIVHNQIWEKHAACWYGEGGVAKSLLAMYLAMQVASPEFSAWLGDIPIKTAPVLCLDFELDESEQHRRLYEIAQGLGLEDVPEDLYYIGATEYPPSAVFEAAASEVERLGIKLVIVDSVGFAVEGDSEIAKDILAFHRTYLEPIKAAGASPLLIDHQAKIVKGEKYSDKTAFGSVYKTNAVRSMFQVRGGKKEDGDGITATFRHTKNNFGPTDDEFSVDVTFRPGKIEVEQRDEAIPNPDRQPTSEELVMAGFEELGKATSERIEKHTGLATKTVRNAITDLKKSGKLEPTGEKDGRYPVLSLRSHSPDLLRDRDRDSRPGHDSEDEAGGSGKDAGTGDADPLGEFWPHVRFRVLKELLWRLDALRRRARRKEQLYINDPARYHELPINEKINLRAWVRENVVPQRTPHSSYALKHIAERDIGGPGYYVGNGELKGAMLEAGYTPLNTSRERGINFYFQAGPREGKE
jgi:hypothetical protein